MASIEISEIKAAIVDRLVEIESLQDVFPEEPSRAMNLPALTIMTEGFVRSSIESPAIEGFESRISDPLGGRAWVVLFKVRLWIALKADAREAQREADLLMFEIVRKWEEDKSFGALLVDSAIASGRVAKVQPSGAAGLNELLMVEMDALAEFEERI